MAVWVSDMELQRNYISAFGLCGYTAHYQPIVSINSSGEKIVAGYESLCRRFTGGAIQFGDEVIRNAKAEKILTELDSFMVSLNVSVAGNVDEGAFITVNVSAQSLVDSRFIDQLKNLDVRGKNLVIEVTESERLPKNAFQLLRENTTNLRRLGWKFAIDDFGDGHSSIRYLNMIDVDIIKISRDFVNDLKSASSAKRNFMSDLILCFNRQKILTVMEGIEVDEDLAIAAELKIDLLQGYMFGRPTSDNQPGRLATMLAPYSKNKL